MGKISRRQFVSTSAFTAGGFVLGYATKSLILSQTLPPPESAVNTPDDALNNLMAGNARYMQGSPIHPNQSAERQAEVAQGQQPWAAILGCIDSRVPPEIVFDQGLGDLFVARTAGQVIDNVVQGSLEFAVEEGVKLIMVLGHQSCGAVKATIQTLQTNGHAEGQIATLVEAIKPAVIEAESQPGDLLDNSVRANVALEVEYLKSSSQIILDALDQGTIELVGARYDLGTGAVSVIS
ncbi:MAG: carbonic anhydrase [Candidatus Bathyarchaeia archaeon]|jgi:carbonic anhydrase